MGKHSTKLKSAFGCITIQKAPNLDAPDSFTLVYNFVTSSSEGPFFLSSSTTAYFSMKYI